MPSPRTATACRGPRRAGAGSRLALAVLGTGSATVLTTFTAGSATALSTLTAGSATALGGALLTRGGTRTRRGPVM